MKIENSKEIFLKIVESSGLNFAGLTPGLGVSLMLKFYKEVRVEGCELDQDGDMLLFEWGTFNFDGTPSFQLVVTRQFILSDPDADQPMSQLSLRFKFSPTSETNDLKNGNQWCHSPNDIEEFKSFIENNGAYLLFKSVSATKISLGHENV